MPDYEKMYTMLNDAITDAIASMERMQKIAQIQLESVQEESTPKENPPKKRRV